jgi:hypothetical protein
VKGKLKKHFVSAFLVTITIGAFYTAPFVFATPPTTPYSPGETLNPSCAPGDVNCTVAAHQADYSIASSTTATSTFAGGIQVNNMPNDTVIKVGKEV